MSLLSNPRFILPINYILFFIIFFFNSTKVTSKIILNPKESLNNFKFANLDGIITSECFNCDIDLWEIEIHTLLPESSPSKNPKAGEFCTILISHAPPKSEVLVSQDKANTNNPKVTRGDEIRYVSVKMPFEVQIFKGELSKCSEYGNAKNLKELIEKLNANLDEREQKDFLMQSYSNILMRQYDLDFPMEDYLSVIFNNLDIIAEFSFLDVNKFSKEQAEVVFGDVIKMMDSMIDKQVTAVLEDIRPFYEHQEAKIEEIRQKIDSEINLLKPKLKENLVKADGNQIIKRFLRTSKEVIDTFFNSRIFKKKRMFLLDNMLFKSPKTYFNDQREVEMGLFVEPYVKIIKDLFDEQINLNMSIHPKFKQQINIYISEIIPILTKELIDAKVDMMQLGKVEADLAKEIGDFLNEELSFNEVFATVIGKFIKKRTIEYLQKWATNPVVGKLGMVNSNLVLVDKMEVAYKMFGNKPFSNLPFKNYFIKFLMFEEELKYI